MCVYALLVSQPSCDRDLYALCLGTITESFLGDFLSLFHLTWCFTSTRLAPRLRANNSIFNGRSFFSGTWLARPSLPGFIATYSKCMSGTKSLFPLIDQTALAVLFLENLPCIPQSGGDAIDGQENGIGQAGAFTFLIACGLLCFFIQHEGTAK